MAREKQTILYSRNGIRIVKTENFNNASNDYFRTFTKQEVIVRSSDNPVNPNYRYKYNNRNTNYIIETKQSKLGFYYTKKKFISYYNYIDNQHNDGISAYYRHYEIAFDNNKYELIYPVELDYKGTIQKINVEMRPWDILPGYKGIPDNMIDVLVKQVQNFIDLLDEHKLILKNGDNKYYRQTIMIDLFGYEDGPKIQSNNIKILSHGFDLKESFRKRKEN